MVNFEENLGLVDKVWFDKFRGAAANLEDDLKQEGRIGLWSACKKYREELGSFSTYAYATIFYMMMNLLKRERGWQSVICLDNEEVLDYVDDFSENVDVSEKEVGYNFLKSELLRECKKSSKKSFEMLNEFINGKRIVDIAKDLNVSRQRVHFVLQSFFSDFRDKYDLKNGEIIRKK